MLLNSSSLGVRKHITEKKRRSWNEKRGCPQAIEKKEKMRKGMLWETKEGWATSRNQQRGNGENWTVTPRQLNYYRGSTIKGAKTSAGTQKKKRSTGPKITNHEEDHLRGELRKSYKRRMKSGT